MTNNKLSRTAKQLASIKSLFNESRNNLHLESVKYLLLEDICKGLALKLTLMELEQEGLL